MLRRIGPGLLLTAAIVGTGELIATTRLGAEVGFVMLWAILFSCVVKTIVQAVWGRYTIATGETGLQALDHFPGPRVLNVNWVVWTWGLIILLSLTLIGAMYAGLAQVMALFIPGVSIGVWVVILTGATLAVLSRMYTETMGAVGLVLFYVGAIAVLYSTVFAATAANSRIFADMMRLMGRFRADDYPARLRYQRAFVVALTVIPCFVYFATGEPVQMIKAGGVVLGLMLPVLAFAVVYLRHRKLTPEVAPSHAATLLLWFVACLMLVTMAAFVLMQLGVLKA